jgi:hypothetical protein
VLESSLSSRYPQLRAGLEKLDKDISDKAALK